MNLNRVIALYIAVAVLVLGGAGVLLAVVVSDVLRDEPVSNPDEFGAHAPATP